MNLSILLILHLLILSLYTSARAESHFDGKIRRSHQDYRLVFDSQSKQAKVNRRSVDVGGSPLPTSDHEEGGNSRLIVEYTLVMANSPDCEPSLSDDFPVRVQYRTISDLEVNAANNWIDSPFQPAFVPGETTILLREP